MAGKCTICYHKDREAIDYALSNKVKYGQIRSNYDVSLKALGSHLKNHLQPILNKANKKAEAKIVDKLVKFREEVNYAPLVKTKMVQAKLIEELDKANETQDKIAIIRELRGWFQEENKLCGNYIEKKENPVNLSNFEKAKQQIRNIINDFSESYQDKENIAQLIDVMAKSKRQQLNESDAQRLKDEFVN